MTAEAIGDFDLDQFSGQLRTGFFTTKRAWSLLKPQVCRHVMTEDLWIDQKSRMEAVRLNGGRNVVRGLIISQVEITGKRRLGQMDEVSARLVVAGADYILHVATNEVMAGSSEPDQWVEEWLMRRSRDAEALAQAANPRCPNCGAPLSLDPEGECRFCAAIPPGPKADWLAAAINRPSVVETGLDDDPRSPAAIAGTPDEALARAQLVGEIRPRAAQADAGALAGIAAIEAHDPALSLGNLLAEAREAFLRLEQVRTEDDLAGLRPYVSDTLWRARVASAEVARTRGQSQVHAFLDVQSIVVAKAESGAQGDRLVLRVVAESADHLIDTHSGRQLAGDNNLLPWTANMVLTRGPGLTSNPLRGLQSHVCPGCGGGLDVGDDGHCRACGKHVTGGEFDWILSAVETPPASAGKSPG